MQHRNSISFNIVECNILNSVGHHVASCGIMLYDIEWSLISIKHLMQHRSTFLHSRCKSSLGQGQQVVWPKTRDHYSYRVFDLHSSGPHLTTCCTRLATQFNTIQQSWIQKRWMMLHSFGLGFRVRLLIIRSCWLITRENDSSNFELVRFVMLMQLSAFFYEKETFLSDTWAGIHSSEWKSFWRGKWALGFAAHSQSQKVRSLDWQGALEMVETGWAVANFERSYFMKRRCIPTSAAPISSYP